MFPLSWKGGGLKNADWVVVLYSCQRKFRALSYHSKVIMRTLEKIKRNYDVVLGLLILVIFYFDKRIVKRKRNYGFEEKVKLLSIIVIFFVITGVTFWKQQVVNLIYHTIALFAEPDFSKKKPTNVNSIEWILIHHSIVWRALGIAKAPFKQMQTNFTLFFKYSAF